MIENVIFDLDGTLVDTSGDIIDCLNKAYTVCARPLSERKINRSFIGPPLSDMIKAITPDITDEERDRVVRAFRNCYDRGEYANTKVFDGVPGMLRNLHNAGLRMFIVTNKPDKPARNILKFLPSDIFTDTITPDQRSGIVLDKREMIYYVMRKWHLWEETTLAVGDSASDVIAAHENGIGAVAVLNGYGDKAEIGVSRPEFTINTIADLYLLIMTMNGREDKR